MIENFVNVLRVIKTVYKELGNLRLMRARGRGGRTVWRKRCR